MTWRTIVFIFLIFNVRGFSQTGGDKVFKTLNLSSSARASALGMRLITVAGEDIALADENPAVANPEMHRQITFNHQFFLAGIQHGQVSFGYDLPKLGYTLHGGFKYLNYGDMQRTDVYGTQSGPLSAGEWVAQVGAGRALSDKWRMGINVNYFQSNLDTYTASGISGDVGFFYEDTARMMTMALVAKHFGTQIDTYLEGDQKEDIPLNIMVGLSKRLRHLPFRFSVTFHHLNQWDLRYDSPNESDDVIFLGDTSKEQSEFSKQVENFFLHTIYSGEFLLGKYEQVRLRLGYNHLINKELSVENIQSLNGLTFGIGIKISQFRLDYGYSKYHIGGKSNHLAISTNLGRFGKNRSVK